MVKEININSPLIQKLEYTLISKDIRKIVEDKNSILVVQEIYLETGEKSRKESIYNKKQVQYIIY